MGPCSPKKPNRNSHVGWHSVEHCPPLGEVIHQLLEGKERKPAHLLWDGSDKQSPQDRCSREPAVVWAIVEPCPPPPGTCASACLTLATLEFYHFHRVYSDSQSISLAAMAGGPEPARSPHGVASCPSFLGDFQPQLDTELPPASCLSPLQSYLPHTYSALCMWCSIFCRLLAMPRLSAFVQSSLLCWEGLNPLLPQSRSHSASKSDLMYQPLQGVFAASVPKGSLPVDYLPALRAWNTVVAPKCILLYVWECWVLLQKTSRTNETH